MSKSEILINETDIIVFRYLCEQWPNGATRTEISTAETVNLPSTTVYDSLVRLKLKGLVESMSCKTHGRGHPPTKWWANPPRILPEMWKRLDHQRTNRGGA